MKVFHYKLGHVAGETMTVAELRAKLAEYPDDMPVFGGWEGVWGYITPEGFGVEKVHKGKAVEVCPSLVIDVENY